MQSCRNLAGGKQSGHTGHLGFRVYTHPAHDIMGGGPDLHRLLSDVKISELHELVIHARQLLFDVFRCVRDFLFNPGNIEKYASMRTASAGSNFVHDTARDVISSEKFRRTARILVALSVAPSFLRIIGGLRFIVFWDFREHKTLAMFVA